MSIIMNEDFENFAASYPISKMSQEGLKEQIDTYAAGGEKTIIFCGNGMRAVFDSQVFEPLWKGLEIHPDGQCFFRGTEVLDTDTAGPRVRSNAVKTRALFENMKNPFQFRIDYGRSLGMKIFIGMRMNDVHNVHNPDNLMVSDLWRNHPDWRVAPFSGEWWGHAFNYAIPEVYDHHLALVREYLTRFDSDGLELDWMRTPYYFKPGCEVENTEILTRFMRETRQCARLAEEKNGHPVSICVRVPSRPDDARRMGFDVPAWIREKLVDRVVVTSYWAVTDFDIPLELWREMLGSDIPITAGLEIICRSKPQDSTSMLNTPEVVFGYASSFYYRGSNDIYLFNHMDGLSGMQDSNGFRQVLETVGNRKQTESQRRRHIVSYLDSLARASGLKTDNILPLDVASVFSHIRLNVGGATKGRCSRLVFAWEGREPTEIRVNSIPCKKSDEEFSDKFPENIQNQGCCRLAADVVKDGDNIISFAAQNNHETIITWCEIDIAAK